MELNEMWTLLEETPVRESEAGGEQGWENHDREGRGAESWGGSPPDCLNLYGRFGKATGERGPKPAIRESLVSRDSSAFLSYRS